MNLTIREISQRLADRAEAVARHLLPQGKKNGAEWCVGDLSGNPGNSLQVHLSGPKAGIWCDFANGQDKGDLIDLWSATRRVTLATAFKEAQEWLGIARLPITGTEKTYRKPNKTGCKALTPEEKVWNYLTKERKLLKTTLDTYKVAEKAGHIVFPYLTPEGECLNLKHLELERVNGKKKTWLEAGCVLSLFGWQAIPHEAREVIVTEGELDALSWNQLGFPALSVPNGCQSTDWIDTEWERLALFDTIFLSYDMDGEGRKGVQEVARRLGLYRCAIIELPRKDMNECLQWGFTYQDAAKALTEAKFISPPEICEPAFFQAKVEEYFRPSSDSAQGFGPSMLDGKLRLRAGELSLLSGTSGHGKSTLWNHMLVEALGEGRRCAFASLEVPPGVTLGIMARQCFGRADVDPENLKLWLDYLAGRLWVFNLFGTQPTALIQELLAYSNARHGVNLFVIDSLMKLDIDGDDYNGQRRYLNTLTKFCLETGSHIILVVHPRKARDEQQELGKLDIKGSSDLFNQADNVMILWRNKEKEKARQKSLADFKAYEDEEDARLYVDKQRLTGEEFHVKLFFLPASKQFKKDKNNSPSVYCTYQ